MTQVETGYTLLRATSDQNCALVKLPGYVDKLLQQSHLLAGVTLIRVM